jgi:uncharacterized delta-60 repeat protein
MIKYFLVLSLFLSSVPNFVFSQISRQWVSQYRHISSADDVAKYAKLDNGRNVYIAGLSDGKFIVTKYNSSGDKLWVAPYLNETYSEDDFLSGLKIDDNRNVYIVGSILASDTTYDIITIKYNTNGVKQWSVQFSGGYKVDDISVGIDVDPSGNVYVVGYNYNTITQNDYVLIKYNSNGVQQWIRRNNGVGNGDDIPVGIIIDGAKNVCVTGSSYNPGTFIDYMTAKYDSTGLLLWNVSYDGVGYDEDIPVAINKDNFNNIYVTGSSYGDTSDIDYAVVQYNSNGAQRWVARYNSPANDADIPVAVEVTNNGDVFVTGYSYDPMSSNDYLTVKFTPDGATAWSARFNSLDFNDDFATSLTVDPSENVYVTGSSAPYDGSFEINTVKYDMAGAAQWVMPYQLSSGNNTESVGILLDPMNNLAVVGTGFMIQSANDLLNLRYTTTGALLWAKRDNELSNESYEDYPKTMMNDNLGNTYVVGTSYDKGTLFDYITIKYNSNGDTIWTARYDGDFNDNDEAIAIGIDTVKNLCVTGNSYSNITNMDIVTIKYTDAGILQWIQKFNGPDNNFDGAVDLTTDAAGNVYIVGYSLNQNSESDILLLKYNANGILQWSNYFNGSNQLNDYPTKLVVDNSGNIYVIGYSATSALSNDYVTIKYNSSGVQQWVQYYNGTGNDNDVAIAIGLDKLGNSYVTGLSVGATSQNDIVTLKYSPSGIQLWERRYNGAANGLDAPKSLSVTSSGEIYIGGWSAGIGTYIDVLILKYSSNGNLLWEKIYNGVANDYDYLEDMFVDSWGNVYASITSPTTPTSNDFLVIKYNSSGIQQWLTKYNNSLNSFDEVTAVKVDSLGNIFVTGAIYDSLDFSDIYTLKYRQSTYISGVAFYDRNNNGVKDGTDLPLSGWRIRLDGAKKDSLITDIDGKYLFADIPFGFYIISEAKKGGWNQTLPVSGTYAPFGVGLGNLSYVFDFGNYSPSAFNYSVDSKWNLVSVPLNVIDGRKTTVFGTANSSAFSFQNGYLPKDTLQNLVGYWLKFSTAQNIWIAGTGFTKDTVDLQAGWNLIGALSVPVSVNSVVTVPLNIIRSQFYGYNNGYTTVDSLRPIKGYWVKIDVDGKLILSSVSAISKPNNNPFAILQKLNKLIVKDKDNKSTILYFGNISDDFEIEQYSLPPLPPYGVLDSRFEGDQSVFVPSAANQREKKILISAEAYPITISWEILDKDENGFELYCSNNSKIKYSLENSGNAELSSKEAAGIYLKYSGKDNSNKLPVTYALNQNYPNPFNPATELKYQLPSASFVSLKVYNVIGQEVATLVSEYETPGFKSVEWDASSMPSGVYIYRLCADHFSDGKKMILMK